MKYSDDLKSKIIKEYKTNSRVSLRDLERRYGASRTSIKRWLQESGISIDSYRQSIESEKSSLERLKKYRGLGARARKGYKFSLKDRLSAVRSRLGIPKSLRFDKFRDPDKLRLLTRKAIRGGIYTRKDESAILNYLEKFYFSPIFTEIYDNWIKSGKEKNLKPSIDHMIPLSRGGTGSLSNLQVLTWFENRVKWDMTQDEWIDFRMRTYTKSDLFVKLD